MPSRLDGKTFCSEWCGNFECPLNRRHLEHGGRDRDEFLSFARSRGRAIIQYANYKLTCGKFEPTAPEFHTAEYLAEAR